MKHLFFSLLLCAAALITKGQQTVGVFVNDILSFEGYTLIVPTSFNNTYLIDNCGREVNRWVSNHPPGLSAYLLANGDLLRTARIPGQFLGGGQGGRIERFNWDGNLVWAFNYASTEYHQHHDVAYLPNGNILLLAWERMSATDAIQAGRNPATVGAIGLWMETIVELQPLDNNEAEVVWKWNLRDHLVQDFDPSKNHYGVVSEEAGRVDINYESGFGNSGPDWVHLNGIAYHPDRDEIVVSSRELSEFWIIDHSTTTQEAAGSTGGNAGRGGELLYRWGNPRTYKRGTAANQKLFVQHDAHWIPPGRPDAGKILIFNNGMGRPEGDYSSLEIVLPPLDPEGKYVLPPLLPYGPAEAEWTYVAPDPTTFFANRVSGAQRLPNGNTLVCEGTKGKIFELSPAGQIVWEYINPIVNFGPLEQGVTPTNNDLFRAYRYGPLFSGLAGKDLSPGVPLELNPLPLVCNDTLTSLARVVGHPEVHCYPNPASERLMVEVDASHTSGLIQVYDLWGRLVLQTAFTEQQTRLDIAELPAGTYRLHLFWNNGARSHQLITVL